MSGPQRAGRGHISNSISALCEGQCVKLLLTRKAETDLVQGVANS